MSDPTTEVKSDGITGSVVIGTVTKVNPFAAYLKLPGLPAAGYLHISQVSDERTDPPLTNTLNEGDRIEVLVKWFDKDHERWETSHRAILKRQRWDSSGCATLGTKFTAKVLKSSELGAVVDMEVVTGTVFAETRYTWNAYTVLYHAGYLQPNESIEVVVDGWDVARAEPRLRLYLGEPQTLARGAVCDGTVIYIHKNVVRECKVQDDIYIRLGGGEIASVGSQELPPFDESPFSIGSTIPLILKKYEYRIGLFEAVIDWARTDLPPPLVPATGSVVDAMVVAVRPFGAICKIAGRVSGLLHHSTIIQENGGDARRHLRLGDVVRAVVEVEPPGPVRRLRRQPDGTRKAVHVDPPKGRFRLKFLQLVDRILDSETPESGELIDLRVARRLGRPSGFERDQNFRWNVLDAFDHTCCVCGARHVFGKASAMEAAHIIPRARRGVDTTQNGLCLCSLHHWAFDKGFFTFDENFCVVVSRQIHDLGEPDSPIARYHGNKIHVTDPTIISVGAIEWHRQNIFLDE